MSSDIVKDIEYWHDSTRLVDYFSAGESESDSTPGIYLFAVQFEHRRGKGRDAILLDKHIIVGGTSVADTYITMPNSLKKPFGFSRQIEAETAKDLQIRSFGKSLPMLLMRAREAVMRRFRPHLRKHDITEQQWRILRVLAEEKNADMLVIAERCSIQPPSLSRTIPLLVQRGLVRRGSHGNDQRRILVDLTPKGRSLFRSMSEESAQIYSQLESEIGAALLEKVYEMLDALIAIAGRGGMDRGEEE